MNPTALIQLMVRYGLVGIVNTLVHWVVFFSLYTLLEWSQSYSNVIAFFVAVTGSFFLNAAFTFKRAVSMKRYVLFTLFMGCLSFLTGMVSDVNALSPWLTLVIFTAVSFVIGFIWSKFFVFKS